MKFRFIYIKFIYFQQSMAAIIVWYFWEILRNILVMLVIIFIFTKANKLTTYLLHLFLPPYGSQSKEQLALLLTTNSIVISKKNFASFQSKTKAIHPLYQNIKSFHMNFFGIEIGNYFLTLLKLTTCRNLQFILFQSAACPHQVSDVRFLLPPGQTALR